MKKLKDIDYDSQFPTYTRAGPPVPKLNTKALVEEKMRAPDYVPPKWEPARPGADDHKKYKTRGFA